LNWNPKWSLEKSLRKIMEWNKKVKILGYKKTCEEQINTFLTNK